MSIADKLKTVAANMTAVYNAGKAAGDGTGDNNELLRRLLEDNKKEDYWEITEDMFTGISHIYIFRFQGNNKLKRVKLAPNIDYLYTGVFINCQALEEVDLNQTRLAYGQVFSGCTALKRVKLSARVTQIGGLTFNGCTSLETLDFSEATRVPILPEKPTDLVTVFQGVPSTCKVLIPAALYDEWVNAAGWSDVSLTYVPADGACIIFESSFALPKKDGYEPRAMVGHYFKIDDDTEMSEDYDVAAGTVISIPNGDEFTFGFYDDGIGYNGYFRASDGTWYKPGVRYTASAGDVLYISGLPACTGHTLSFDKNFTGQLLNADGSIATAFDLYCGNGEDGAEYLTHECVVPSKGDSYPCVHVFSLYTNGSDVPHDNCYALDNKDNKYYCGGDYTLNGDVTITKIVCERPYHNGTAWEWMPRDEFDYILTTENDNCPYCNGVFYFDGGKHIEDNCPYCGESIEFGAPEENTGAAE